MKAARAVAKKADEKKPAARKPAAENAVVKISSGRRGRLAWSVAGLSLVVLVAIGWFWLDRGNQLATLRGHQGMVRTLAFSPDGSLLASAGEDRRIRLWDAASYRLRLALDGHTEAVHGLAFSPDNSLLASASHDGTIRLWDAGAGAEIASFTIAGNSVAFSPDGAVLAAAGKDGKLHLWKVAERKPLRTLPGHARSTRSLAFARDGKTLVSGGEDGSVCLWDWKTGKSIAKLQAGGRVYAVAFTPDGRTIAASTGAGVRWWDVATRQERSKLSDGAGLAMTLSFAPDSRLLATGHQDGALKVWDTADNKLLHVEPAHARSVLAVASAPDGARLASAGLDGTVKFWPIRN